MALVAPKRLMAKVSAFSKTVSPKIGTAMVWLVVPGPKFSMPEVLE